MMSPAYMYQSSWDLYQYFVLHQNTSEGICDALLAVSEAMRQFTPGTSMPEPALVELGKHISQQTLKFVKDDIPDLVRCQRGLYQNLWSNQFLASTSRGLKQSTEWITIRFFEDLTRSFSQLSTRSTYTPGLVHEAFKKLAVSFEDALGREYDDSQRTLAASTANGVATLSASLHKLSISDYQFAASETPAQFSRSEDCFNCGQPGHWSSNCPYSRNGSTTSPKYPSTYSYYSCGAMGHWANNCPRPQTRSVTPPRSSASLPSGNCYTCGQPGHWSSSCTTPRRRSATTPSRTLSNDACFNCGQKGHWSSRCPQRRGAWYP
jgi:hypothetical protein